MHKILIYYIMIKTRPATQGQPTTREIATAAGALYYIDYVHNTEYGRKYWYFIFARVADDAILYANKSRAAVVEYGQQYKKREIWDFVNNDWARNLMK